MDIKNRSEILFLYDVTNGNPNGDPSDENKPRIDEETSYNIVTDVRLKRTIRDYLFNFKGFNEENNKDIFVRQTKHIDTSGKEKGLNDGKSRALSFGTTKKEGLKNIVERCIDIRLFGGVIPLEKDSITFTGPVQFKMGRSLHRVELKHIKGTGAFASKAGAEQQTFREEYILPYSLIAFYGIVNENAAQHTNLTEIDLNLLYEAIWLGTKNLITRSKMEHQPRFLMVITYKEPNFFIGELDKLINLNTSLANDETIRDISEIEINAERLSETIGNNRDKIESIRIIKNERLRLINDSFSSEASSFSFLL